MIDARTDLAAEGLPARTGGAGELIIGPATPAGGVPIEAKAAPEEGPHLPSSVDSRRENTPEAARPMAGALCAATGQAAVASTLVVSAISSQSAEATPNSGSNTELAPASVGAAEAATMDDRSAQTDAARHQDDIPADDAQRHGAAADQPHAHEPVVAAPDHSAGAQPVDCHADSTHTDDRRNRLKNGSLRLRRERCPRQPIPTI